MAELAGEAILAIATSIGTAILAYEDYQDAVRAATGDSEAAAVAMEMVEAFAADTAFFGGHFPDDPIVPGVILLEFVAQTANLLLSHRVGKVVQGFLVGVEEAKFNLSVRPGQTVVAEVRFSRELAPGADLGAERFVGFKGSVSLEGRRCMRAAINIYQGG